MKNRFVIYRSATAAAVVAVAGGLLGRATAGEEAWTVVVTPATRSIPQTVGSLPDRVEETRRVPVVKGPLPMALSLEPTSAIQAPTRPPAAAVERFRVEASAASSSAPTSATPRSRTEILPPSTPEYDSKTSDPTTDLRPAQQYCLNIADAATDARLAWHKKTLAEMEKALSARIAALEAKRAEVEKWLVRRDDFLHKAQDSLVRIYSKMRPDAASAQLVALDEETAAAVLMQLDPRNASVILNEMDPAHAARLTAIISGAARLPNEHSAHRATEGRKS
jgi:flagellar motility protein MotE (MotC chaperone)